MSRRNIPLGAPAEWTITAARIWPGDIELTLRGLPATELQVRKIEDPFCTHALIDASEGTSVRVIEGKADWPVEQVQRAFKKG